MLQALQDLADNTFPSIIIFPLSTCHFSAAALNTENHSGMLGPREDDLLQFLFHDIGRFPQWRRSWTGWCQSQVVIQTQLASQLHPWTFGVYLWLRLCPYPHWRNWYLFLLCEGFLFVWQLNVDAKNKNWEWTLVVSNKSWFVNRIKLNQQQSKGGKEKRNLT